jgi:hypothetical protein
MPEGRCRSPLLTIDLPFVTILVRFVSLAVPLIDFKGHSSFVRLGTQPATPRGTADEPRASTRSSLFATKPGGLTGGDEPQVPFKHLIIVEVLTMSTILRLIRPNQSQVTDQKYHKSAISQSPDHQISSLVSQRHHGIDFRRPLRWEVPGQQRHGCEQNRCQREG